MIDEVVEDMGREAAELLIGDIERGAAEIEELQKLLNQLRGDRIPDHMRCTPGAIQVVMTVGNPLAVNENVDNFWYRQRARYGGRVYEALTTGPVPQFESFRPG